MSISGKFTQTSADNVAAFFKALGASDEALAKGAEKVPDEKTLTVTDNGGDSYTLDLGHGDKAKNTFTVGKEFEHTFAKFNAK